MLRTENSAIAKTFLWICLVILLCRMTGMLHAEEDDVGSGSIVWVSFGPFGPTSPLPASNLTKDEQGKVIESVKEKFAGTDVTIVDSREGFIEEKNKNPKKTRHEIHVTSFSGATGVLGHARHCGPSGKVYDNRYIDKNRNPQYDELREDPTDPKSPLDSDKLVNGIENTAAHEIGHLLGLDDDTDPKSKPNIMTLPFTRKDDATSLSFTDDDKEKIKNGKFKKSTPDPKKKNRQMSFVRGSRDPILPEGFFERTDWVPISFEISSELSEVSLGYMNILGGFYALSESRGSGIFNFAPSVPFDLALQRLSDNSIFTLSEDAISVTFADEIAGSEARFPFDGVYYAEAQILFDTTGDSLGDASVLLKSAVPGCQNGLTLDSVPYAPELEYPSSVDHSGKLHTLWGYMKQTELYQNYPNPFNPDTWIPFQLAEDAGIKIRIYDVSGQLIRTMDLGRKPAGSYTTKDRAAYWDGRNEAGEQVSSGVYFYTIQAGEFTATRKMVVAR